MFVFLVLIIIFNKLVENMKIEVSDFALSLEFIFDYKNQNFDLFYFAGNAK